MTRTNVVSGDTLTAEVGALSSVGAADDYVLPTQSLTENDGQFVAQAFINPRNAHIPHPVHALVHDLLTLAKRKTFKPAFQEHSRKNDLATLSKIHSSFTAPQEKARGAKLTLVIAGRLLNAFQELNLPASDRRALASLLARHDRLKRDRYDASLKEASPAAPSSKTVFLSGGTANKLDKHVALVGQDEKPKPTPVKGAVKRRRPPPPNHYTRLHLNLLLLGSLAPEQPAPPKRTTFKRHNHQTLGL